MNEKKEEQSRIAQMAVELFGAKAAKQLIEEIWNTAPEDVKAEFSKAVIEQIRDLLKDAAYQWEINRQLEEHIVELTKKTLADPVWAEPIRSRIDKALAVAWRDIIEKEVLRCVEQTTRGVLGQIADGLHKARQG